MGREPKSYHFDHLLEKSSYPELKFDKTNIVLLTGDEHTNKGGPAEHPEHTKLIKKKYEEQKFKE